MEFITRHPERSANVCFVGGKRGNVGISDYLRICGSQHGITATVGGTSSERFCVGLFCRNVCVGAEFGRKFRSGSGGELGLSGSVLLRSSPKNHAALPSRTHRFCSTISLRRKFSFALLDTEKFEGRFLAFFIDFSLVKNAFSNFH